MRMETSLHHSSMEVYMSHNHLIQFITFLTVSSLIACTDSKTAQLKSETAKLKQDIALKEDKLNRIRQGGQPGLIKISIADSPKSSEELNKIIITAMPGKSYDGSTPELRSNQIQIETLTPEKQTLEFNFLEEFKIDQKLINIGCNEELVSTYSNQETIVFDEQLILPNLKLIKDGHYDLSAATVLLCKTNNLQKHDISITAKTIVMNGFNFETRENSSLFNSIIKLKTDKLILNGNNKLFSRHEDSPISAIHEAGSIEITAQEITGEGYLHIETIGADGL